MKQYAAVFFLLLFAGQVYAATLNWTAPTTNTDGSTPAVYDGFNIYADCGSGYTRIGSVGKVTTAQAQDCNSYYVTAYSQSGESAPSNIAYLDRSVPGAPVIACSQCQTPDPVVCPDPVICPEPTVCPDPAPDPTPAPDPEVAWIVAKNGSHPDRPVYGRWTYFINKTQIGRVAVGTPCGEFVACYYKDCRKYSRENRAIMLGPEAGVVLCEPK